MLINISAIISNLRAFLALLLSFLISACNVADISYISRSQVKTATFAKEKPIYSEKNPMSLGALRILRKDSKEGETGQVFFLQRKKKIYMAETKLADTGKKRYFFSLGIDYRNRTPAIGFRVEF